MRDPNGRPSLVVWLQHQATVPATFTLRGAKPEASDSTLKPMTWAALPQMASDLAAVKMWYGGGMDNHCDWGYATSTNGVQSVFRGKLSALAAKDGR